MTLINKEKLLAEMERYYNQTEGSHSDTFILYSAGLFETVRDFEEEPKKSDYLRGYKDGYRDGLKDGRES